MKHKIEAKDEVYEDLFDHVMHLLNEHQLPAELVAGCLMAIAQRLYRTHLNDEEYKQIMDVIKDAPVEPYEVKKESIH